MTHAEVERKQRDRGVGSTPRGRRCRPRSDPARERLLELGPSRACRGRSKTRPARPERRGRPSRSTSSASAPRRRSPRTTVGSEVLARYVRRRTLQARKRASALGELRRLARLVQAGLLALDLRASRVRKPSRLSGTRSSGSASTSARAMPWRTRPAWPVGHRRGRGRGGRTCPRAGDLERRERDRAVRRPREVLLDRAAVEPRRPSPGRRITRATEVLRLPVPRYCATSLIAQLQRLRRCGSCGCSGRRRS
jgi:hypothetical protein